MHLAAGMIRGIGPSYAKRSVRAFGAEVFDVIEQSPATLRDVSGIEPLHAERLCAAWSDRRWCGRPWRSCTATG